MSGPDYPDSPPPEVPEEFADAYREAYRRALEPEPVPEPLPEAPALQDPGRTVADWRREPWFLPAVVGVSALVLVGAAYAVGQAISGDGSREPGAAHPSAVHTLGHTPGHTARARATHSPGRQPTRPEPSTSPGGWKGPVDAVAVDAISADCTAPPSNDSGGHRVTYAPGNAVDGRPATAWRCDGSAVGQTLTLRIGGSVDVAEVGLVPGYAKTDPVDGTDRYAENNRITKVRWTFGDGVSVVQRLDPDPSTRAMQRLRVPRTSTDRITLEILAVRHGSRDTTAISEIEVAAAR